MDALINKVIISPESVFDYTEILQCNMPKKDIKMQLEEYLMNFLSQNRREVFTLKVKYYDEQADRMVELFLSRHYKMGLIQLWLLEGVCLSEDVIRELEDGGIIRGWLKSRINLLDLPTTDWVVRLRAIEIVNHLPAYSIQGISREVINAFKGNGDKETARELPFIQTPNRKRHRGKRTDPKGAVARKMCRGTGSAKL